MTEKQGKTKVLYIITKSVWGGAQKYVFDLASNLPRDKFDVFVAAGGQGLMAEKLKASRIFYFEIKSFQRDISFRKDIFTFFEILFLLFKTKPDVIHVSSAKAGGVSGAAICVYNIFQKLKAKSYNLKAIFTVHGWTFNEQRPAWQIFLIKLFSKITCFFYDKIICVSEYDYNCAIKNKIAPARKLVMIHNGIKEVDYDFSTREEARRLLIQKIITNTQKAPSNLPLKEEATPSPSGEGWGEAASLWLGTIGEFTKNKGQKYLIDALKILIAKHYTLNVVLVGHGELKTELQKQIDDFGLQNQVFLIDNLPDASKYLKAFDIFVLPSIKEGLPYALLEAGLARVPMVATDIGGIKEILAPSTEKIPLNLPLKNGETTLSSSSPSFEKGGARWIFPAGILVPPADTQALAEAIKILTQNAPLRHDFAEQARKKILKDFSLEKMLEETIKTYEK